MGSDSEGVADLLPLVYFVPRNLPAIVSTNLVLLGHLRGSVPLGPEFKHQLLGLNHIRIITGPALASLIPNRCYLQCTILATASLQLDKHQVVQERMAKLKGIGAVHSTDYILISQPKIFQSGVTWCMCLQLERFCAFHHQHYISKNTRHILKAVAK